MSLTEGSIYSSYFNSVITLAGTSDELFCDKVLWTILHNNSSDVPTNVITELKDDEHIEPSVIDKGSSYFNIL